MTSYLHGFIQLNATLENGNEFELTRGSPILRHALLGVVFGSVNISVCSQNSWNYTYMSGKDEFHEKSLIQKIA